MMDDSDKIRDLERRVSILEDVIAKLTICDDGKLGCRDGEDIFGNTVTTSLGKYIQKQGGFGRRDFYL